MLSTIPTRALHLGLRISLLIIGGGADANLMFEGLHPLQIPQPAFLLFLLAVPRLKVGDSVTAILIVIVIIFITFTVDNEWVILFARLLAPAGRLWVLLGVELHLHGVVELQPLELPLDVACRDSQQLVLMILA